MVAKRTTFLDGVAPLLLILGVVAFVAIVGVMRFGGLPGAPISPDEERSLVGQAAGPRPIPLREVVTCAFVGGNGTRSCVSSYGQCSTTGVSCAVKVAGIGGSVVRWVTTNCAGANGTSVIDGKSETVTFSCGASCTNECVAGTSRCFNGTYVQPCGNYDSDPCTEWGSINGCAPGNVCQSGACVPSCTNECTLGVSQCLNEISLRTCGNYDADPCAEWGGVTSCALGTICQSGSCAPVAPPASCADSDGGFNIYLFGQITLNGTIPAGADSCMNQTIREWYCEGSEQRSQLIACGYDCDGGACVDDPGNTTKG